MSSADEYQVQNVYKYSRKSYKKCRRNIDDGGSPTPREEIEVIDLPISPGCSCDLDTEGDVAHILHKKCPVISLAQQQLQKLVEGTDKLLCENSPTCRSAYDFICICKSLLRSQNKSQCALLFLIGVAFFVGILLGSATCGAYLGRFNSPILTCIDNLFVSDSYNSIQDSFHSIF